MISKQLVNNALGPLVNSFGGMFGLSGLSASADTGAVAAVAGHGLYHSGGIVGAEPTAVRLVNPEMFVGARRFHSGGIAGDEVPIIAKRGEGVFTPGQMSAMGGSGSVTNNIIIENNTGQTATQSQQKNSSGGTDTRITFGAAMNERFGSGSMDSVMKGRYGIVPIGSRR